MQNQNPYDKFIDEISQKFSQIKNFHLIQEDENSTAIFNFIIKRLADIYSFKTLITHYYLPAASKSIVDNLNEIKSSKYRHLIDISREDLKENYYETIRFAYVGMFHKYENYVDDLIIHSELLISETSESTQPLTKFIEEKFNYRIKGWKNSPTIDRLNWITICIKHYDGYPRKMPKPKEYQNLPDNMKMKFTKEDFIRDIGLLIDYFSMMLQIVFVFSLYKSTFEEYVSSKDQLNDGDPIYKQMDKQLRSLIELNKKY